MRSHTKPTIGFISTWPVYQSTTIDRCAHSLIQGISAAASEQRCHLLPECGFSLSGKDPQNPSFWEQSEYVRALLASGFPVIFTTPEGPGPVVAVDARCPWWDASWTAVHGNR